MSTMTAGTGWRRAWQGTVAWRRVLAAVVCLAAMGAPGAAHGQGGQVGQGPEVPVLAIPKADTVLLYLTVQPPTFGGFVVDRAVPGGQPTRLTDAPVRRVRDPSVAAGILGDDLERVRATVRAATDAELLRRLNSDRFTGAVFSLVLRPVARVTGRFYADTTAVPGETYTYTVTLTDGDGAELDSTFEATVTVEDVDPAPPTDVAVEASDARVHLSWEYPAYTGDPGDFTIGFHVQRARGRQEFRRLTDLPVIRDDAGPLEYYDEGVRNGTTYRYRVMAVGIAGRESPPVASSPVTPRDTTSPTPPGDLRVQVGDGQALLAWRRSPELDVAGYHVERSSGVNDAYERLNGQVVPGRQSRWLDTTALGATRYFYRVLAVDSAGNVSRPTSAVMAVVADETPPEPPESVTVEVNDRRLTIRWAASPSPDVQGYYVFRGPAEDRLVRLNDEPMPGTQRVDSGYAQGGLTPGNHYVVHVVAADYGENESEPAVARSVIPDDVAPDPPSSMRVTNRYGRHAEILWSASRSRDIAFYELTRRTGGRDTVIARPGKADRREVRDSALVEGRTYVYELVAVDSAQNRSSAAVDTVRFGDFTPPPSPRFADAASAQDGGVEIRWERVVDDELVGYHVYRAGLPTGQYERVTEQPVTGLTFRDPEGRTDHYYVVRAVDASGNESRASDPVTAGMP